MCLMVSPFQTSRFFVNNYWMHCSWYDYRPLWFEIFYTRVVTSYVPKIHYPFRVKVLQLCSRNYVDMWYWHIPSCLLTRSTMSGPTTGEQTGITSVIPPNPIFQRKIKTGNPEPLYRIVHIPEIYCQGVLKSCFRKSVTLWPLYKSGLIRLFPVCEGLII